MPTIFDVARHASVSVTTVSRVLNDAPTVRPAIRRAVQQAIAELGYVPDGTARGLRKAQSNSIGLAVPDLSTGSFQEIVEGIEGEVRRNGYSLLLYDNRHQPEIQTANLTRMIERRVDGMILYPLGPTIPERTLIEGAAVPALVVGWSDRAYGLPTLAINQRSGLRDAVAHLRGLGHERIAFVSRLALHPGGPEADRRFLQALGLDYDPSLVVLPSSRAQCLPAVAALLSRRNRPTALLLGTHVYAPYVLGGVAAAGLAIPEDVSFVTMGDSPWATYYRPPLNVVNFDRVEAGRRAAAYVLGRIAGEDRVDLLQEMASALTVRGSGAAPPA